jgi:hypothetical protein
LHGSFQVALHAVSGRHKRQRRAEIWMRVGDPCTHG